MSQTPSSGRNSVTGFLSKLTAKNWIAIAGAVLAVVFIVQNRQHVRVELFFLSLNAPLWIALGVVMLTGWLVGRFSIRKR